MVQELTLAPPEAVVIHCSDFRFQVAIHSFIRTRLTMDSYDLLVVPGGAHAVSLPAVLPKQHAAEKQHLKFLVTFHHLSRIILLDHEDCAFFNHRLAYFFPQPSFNEKQMVNTRTACTVLRRWYPTLTVDAYFAEIAEMKKVRFVKID